MNDDKLTEKERALIAAARREAEARKSGTFVPPTAPSGTAAATAPARATPPAAASVPQEKPKPTPAERLAQLMAAERAETELKKKKMRRYGIIIPGAILAVALLSLLRSLWRR